jgi:uncharacterized membrane protein YvbJ
MSIIQNIQKKSQKEKLRIMWAIGIIVVALLIIIWVISAHFQKNTNTDNTLFDTIGNGFHNLKENYKK